MGPRLLIARMFLLRILPAAFSVLTIFGSPAGAMDFIVQRQNDAIIINATGGIRPGDFAKLAATLRRSPKPTTVRLTSPGGNLSEALKMGELIRAEMLATVVPSEATCASACVHMFASGVIREAGSGAKIIVHNASVISSDEYIRKLRGILTNRDYDLDTRIRVITLLNEQTSAQAMSRQASYFQKMGVSLQLLFPISDTSFVDGRQLSLAELKKLNLINAD